MTGRCAKLARSVSAFALSREFLGLRSQGWLSQVNPLTGLCLLLYSDQGSLAP